MTSLLILVALEPFGPRPKLEVPLERVRYHRVRPTQVVL